MQKLQRSLIMIIAVKVNTTKLIKYVRLEEVNGEEFDANQLLNQAGNLAISF